MIVSLGTPLLTLAQISENDSLPVVKTIGIFDGKLVTVGNFNADRAYRMNGYCISPSDLSPTGADSLNGKRVLISGKLEIIAAVVFPAKTSNDDRIYEPYIEPERKYIREPQFTIVWDSREPEKNE